MKYYDYNSISQTLKNMESGQSHVKKKTWSQQGKAHIWKYKDTHKKGIYFLLSLSFSRPASRLVRPPGQQHIRPPSLTISWSLPKFMPIALVMPSSHLILWHPLLLLLSIFPSIRDFSSELAAWIRWPNYWSFSFSISPSKDYSGWFPVRLTGLISLLSKGLSGVFSNTTVWRLQFFGILPSL